MARCALRRFRDSEKSARASRCSASTRPPLEGVLGAEAAIKFARASTSTLAASTCWLIPGTVGAADMAAENGRREGDGGGRALECMLQGHNGMMNASHKKQIFDAPLNSQLSVDGLSGKARDENARPAFLFFIFSSPLGNGQVSACTYSCISTSCPLPRRPRLATATMVVAARAGRRRLGAAPTRVRREEY